MDKENTFNSPSIFKKIPLRISVYTFIIYLLIISLFVFLINFIKVNEELELKDLTKNYSDKIVFCLNAQELKSDDYHIKALKLSNIKKNETVSIPYNTLSGTLKDNCFTFKNNETTNIELFKKYPGSDKQFLVVSFTVWDILRFYYDI